MQRRPLVLVSQCLLLAFLSMPARAGAAAPSAELLRLVPDDVAFCLVVQDLRGHSQSVLNSPFMEKLRASKLGAAIQSAPELAKLAEVEKHFQNLLGISWSQLRNDILGDAVVLAYRLGPNGQEDQEQGLVLLRARNEKSLTAVIERLNDAQKKSGDLKAVEERDHNGRKYFRRAERKGANFYWLNGPVLVFSTREEMLRQALDLDRTAAPAEKDPPPVARSLRQLGAEQALAALWINPRAFESELQRKTVSSQGAEGHFLKTFANYWKAVQGIAVHVTLRQEMEFGLSVQVKPEVLPGAGRKFFAKDAKPTDLWSSFGDNPLLAVAGRVDTAACVTFLSDFFSDDARKVVGLLVDRNLRAVLGKDIASEVLPCIGPDWGLCISAPPQAEKGWFPYIIGALRVRPGDGESGVDQSLFTALNSLAVLLILDHNGKHADQLVLKSTTHDKVEIKFLVNDKAFPPGLRPAFALKSGYLVLASSPEAIRRFAPSSSRAANAESSEVPLFRVSLVALRSYLKERRDALTAYAADKNHITKEEAARRLDDLLVGLELFDRLELTQRTGPSQATWTLRVRPAAALRN